MDQPAHSLFSWLQDIRRDLHAHPELSFQEHRTTRKIRRILEDLGVEIQELPGMETGVVGLIRGRPGDKTLALRGDIDALPINEENNVPYRSQNPGVMHACGHDAHTAILLGVARTLMAPPGPEKMIRGNLKLLFQPAEENTRGARCMIEAGALLNPEVTRIMAFHVWPHLKVGEAGGAPGVSHASADRFRVHIRGKGCHGAHPEDGSDPILAGAHLVTGLQSIVSRNLAGTEAAVLTVGSFHAGTAANIVPAEAVLRGTIRTLEKGVRHAVLERMAELCEGLSHGFRVEAALSIEEGVPACVNHPEVLESLMEAASSVLGKRAIKPLGPSMGSEDFGLFTRQVPGALLRLGCAPPREGPGPPLHSPLFDVDEQVLPLGVEIFLRAATHYLA